MKRLSRYLLGIASAVALGLVAWLPLRAQEAPAPAAPAATTPAKPATEAEEAAPPKPDESLSADNSISFPVDI